jgi:RNA 2',3'-cyclic 3'-phosphodiesterase
MHLTLHYIGEAEADRVSLALRDLRHNRVRLKIAGVGEFRSGDGSVTLWARVEPTAELRSVHASVAAALASIGITAGARPWVPHITLARCRADAPAAVVARLLDAGASLVHSDSMIDTASLCSSLFVGGAPRYTREASIPLLG